MLSGKWRPFCIGLNVLIDYSFYNSQSAMIFKEIFSPISIMTFEQ